MCYFGQWVHSDSFPVKDHDGLWFMGPIISAGTYWSGSNSELPWLPCKSTKKSWCACWVTFRRCSYWGGVSAKSTKLARWLLAKPVFARLVVLPPDTVEKNDALGHMNVGTFHLPIMISVANETSGLEYEASSGDGGIGEGAFRRKWNTGRFPRCKGQLNFLNSNRFPL